MRFLRRSLVGIFLLSVTLALLAWAGNTVRGAVQERMAQEPRSFPQRERVFAVNVLTLEPQNLTPELTVFGELRSGRTLDVRSPVGGTVLRADPALTDGGVVKAGQLLLQIDPAEAEAVRDRARVDFQDAESARRDAERTLALARDELAAAEGQLVLQQAALTRARDLQTRGVGTAASVESAELAVSSAGASVLARRQSLAQSEARLDQAITSLARQQINLDEANRDVAATEIFAAFDGVMADVTITNGGRVSPNEKVAQLVDASLLEVAFRVSNSQYARLLDGNGSLLQAAVSVALDASGVNLIAKGQITRESAGVAAGQTGRLLFATLDTAPGFRPGDFVTVRIAEPELTNVALIPASAVAADGTVLVLDDDNRLASAEIAVLRRQGDDVIVQPRALTGQTIVAERSPLLGAGIKVTPIAPAGSAPQTPEMITLDPERKARIVAFVEASRMPDEAKARILSQLEQPEIPAATIARIEERMGS